MRASYRDLVVLSVVSLAAVSAMGCRRTDRQAGSLAERVGTATLTGAAVYVPGDIAREQLAQARCELAEKCEQIGEGKRYRDLSDCTVRVQLELQPELDKKECPAGADEIALRECVDLTAHGGCLDADSPEAARREAVCSMSRICKKP